MSLEGNILARSNNYHFIINKMFPQLTNFDPQNIKDLSQFQSMEFYCFSDMHPDNIQVKLKFDSFGKEKERSKTPNRDKSGSRLETLPKEK